MWREHYRDIFNSLTYSADDIEYINSKIQNVKSCHDMPVSYDEVYIAAHILQCGKACGKDLLFPEHIKYADDTLCLLLSYLFTFMLFHGYMPENMLSAVLSPVIKNKNASLNVKKNYRPVCISTVISKIFEKVLLKRIESYISTCSNQFGFKSNHGTEMCVICVKRTCKILLLSGIQHLCMFFRCINGF